MNKTGRVRALQLTVAEVDDILASLYDARGIKDLKGQQRKQLEDAAQSLTRLRDTAVGQFVRVPVETLVQVLGCVSMTQRWLQDMFNDYAVEYADE